MTTGVTSAKSEREKVTQEEKPVVKYRTSKFRFAGRNYTNRYRLTLLTTFEGELAKKMSELSNAGKLYWSYYDTKGKEKLEIYEEKTLSAKP